MSEEEIEIPEGLQQICRDLATVAQKHGLRSLSGNFQPNTNWGGDIHFRWTAGITSNFHVHTKVNRT